MHDRFSFQILLCLNEDAMEFQQDKTPRSVIKIFRILNSETELKTRTAREKDTGTSARNHLSNILLLAETYKGKIQCRHTHS